MIYLLAYIAGAIIVGSFCIAVTLVAADQKQKDEPPFVIAAIVLGLVAGAVWPMTALTCLLFAWMAKRAKKA